MTDSACFTARFQRAEHTKYVFICPIWGIRLSVMDFTEVKAAAAWLGKHYMHIDWGLFTP